MTRALACIFALFLALPALAADRLAVLYFDAHALGEDMSPLGRGIADMLARLSPDPAKARAWAECAAEIGARARHGRAVNLDPAALVLDTVFRIQQTAAG